jgi:hypothetical protein
MPGALNTLGYVYKGVWGSASSKMSLSTNLGQIGGLGKSELAVSTVMKHYALRETVGMIGTQRRLYRVE